MILLKKIKDIIKKHKLIPSYCKKCGRTTIPNFYVPNKTWNQVTNNSTDELCIVCFDKLARNKGIYIIWEAQDE